MKIVRIYFLSLAIFMVAASNFSHAADENPALFKFSGFATLGASNSSENDGDYVPDATVPKGAGFSDVWAFGNDSRLGLQAAADLTPDVTVVLQVISEYQYDNTYRPIVEWANIKYEITPDFYVRAGRIALPTFLNSDTRKVGYSYPWIHPPVEIYRQLAITNSDGVDTMYRFNIGEASNTIRAIYGRNRINRLTSYSLSRNLWGIFDTFEYENATFHFGYQERESSSVNRTTGLSGTWSKNNDLSLGASYDPGDWFITGEWIQRESTYRKIAWYTSAGMRMGDFTPYFSYCTDSPPSYIAGDTPPTASTIRLATRSQHTTTFGTRWDFRKNADLKLQFDLVSLSDNSNGYLANVPANVQLNGSQFHVISIISDFIF